MESYREGLYPALPKDGESFRLQQACGALQKLEDEAKHSEVMRRKYKRYHDALAKVSVTAGTLSFISSASGVGTVLSVLASPPAHLWERLG